MRPRFRRAPVARVDIHVRLPEAVADKVFALAEANQESTTATCTALVVDGINRQTADPEASR